MSCLIKVVVRYVRRLEGVLSRISGAAQGAALAPPGDTSTKSAAASAESLGGGVLRTAAQRKCFVDTLEVCAFTYIHECISVGG